MFSVVIVDDEKAIREGLSRLIDWESLGFCVAGMEPDAISALELIERIRPDLVIADIKMPQMDGIEMVSRLRADGCDAHIILISGYAEFEYARTALQHGVKAYLIKPVDKRTLTKEVDAAREALLARDRKDGEQAMAPKLTREKLTELFLAGQLSAEQMEKSIPYLNYDMDRVRYRALLLQYPPGERSSLDSFKALLKGFCADNRCDYLYCTRRNAALLSTHERFDDLSILRALRTEAAHFVGADVKIAVGKTVRSFFDLHLSCEEAKRAMDDMFLYGYQGVVSADDRPPLPYQEPMAVQALSEELLVALQCGSIHQVEQLLEKEWIRPLQSIRAGEMDVKAKTTGLFIHLVESLMASWPEVDASFCDRQAFIECVHFQDSIREVKEALIFRLEAINRRIADLQPDVGFSKVLQYIDRNYMRPITVNTLAKTMHYNRSYLGRKFKKHTGEFFNAYLDKVRIRKAQELLREGHRVYQAAQMVGFTDTDYFNAKFRKYVHMSPTAYRAEAESEEN